MNNEIPYLPNWISPPGETILDILHAKNLTLGEFAKQVGYNIKFTNSLLRGTEVLTPVIAKKLELLLGGSKSFWINRESQFREDSIRVQKWSREVRHWLKKFPLKEMVKFGWIKPSSNLKETELICLKFFNINSIDEWYDKYNSLLTFTAFKTSKSFDSIPESVVTWIRQGEIEAETINCEGWNPASLRKILPQIRKLTFLKEPKIFIPRLQELCAKCGVAVVVVPAPTGCRASGATLFVKHNKASILLSLRYLSDDHFWFSFFHEIGHLLLHGMDSIFIEGVDEEKTPDENEANSFAAKVLIPPEYQKELKLFTANKWQDIIRFSNKVGISPGILVGQLQKLGILRYNQLNNLKRKFKWDFK